MKVIFNPSSAFMPRRLSTEPTLLFPFCVLSPNQSLPLKKTTPSCKDERNIQFSSTIHYHEIQSCIEK